MRNFKGLVRRGFYLDGGSEPSVLASWVEAVIVWHDHAGGRSVEEPRAPSLPSSVSVP
jgi:hypothetical protein